jgi:hypothetical protein
LGYSLLLAALSLHAPGQTPDSPRPADSKPVIDRLTTFYKLDWHPDPNAPASPAAPRRGLPQPLDSPPFPSADWSYGGSPTIGEADGNSYPLMTAINEGKSRTKLYGWFDLTVNGSTSAHRNSPEANDLYSNRFELNQAVLYLERLPDSVQRGHIDVGYHLTALYGTDYRYTTDKGYFSSQLLAHNHQYGFDPALEYVDVYFPHVAQGMNLRVGRFISIPGIEAQLSPNNYVFSHSLLYSVDPFTDTGVLATIQISQQWLVQLGLTASHDVALWTADAKPSADVCVSYTTRSVADNFYVCANGINDGVYAFNNLQQYDATWYHKLSKTVHIATEAYVMYERNVPAVDPVTVAAITPEIGTNGAFCHVGQVRCLAPEWAIDNYINKELSPHRYISLRTDFLDDKKGQRTGYQTRYFEDTFSFNQWIGSTIQFRPEVRFDHAWDHAAYDNGTHRNQFTAAADLILHF